jgi:hypothetical protein
MNGDPGPALPTKVDVKMKDQLLEAGEGQDQGKSAAVEKNLDLMKDITIIPVVDAEVTVVSTVEMIVGETKDVRETRKETANVNVKELGKKTENTVEKRKERKDTKRKRKLVAVAARGEAKSADGDLINLE